MRILVLCHTRLDDLKSCPVPLPVTQNSVRDMVSVDLAPRADLRADWARPLPPRVLRRLQARFDVVASWCCTYDVFFAPGVGVNGDAVRNARAALRPGGLLVVVVPDFAFAVVDLGKCSRAARAPFPVGESGTGEPHGRRAVARCRDLAGRDARTAAADPYSQAALQASAKKLTDARRRALLRAIGAGMRAAAGGALEPLEGRAKAQAIVGISEAYHQQRFHAAALRDELRYTAARMVVLRGVAPPTTPQAPAAQSERERSPGVARD